LSEVFGKTLGWRRPEETRIFSKEEIGKWNGKETRYLLTGGERRGLFLVYETTEGNTGGGTRTGKWGSKKKKTQL